MEKRALLSVLLCFIVFFGYTKVLQFFYPGYGKPKEKIEQKIQEDVLSGKIDTPQVSFKDVAPGVISEEEIVQGETLGVTVGDYELGISEAHASIVSVGFWSYENLDDGGPWKFLEAQSGRVGVGAVELWVDGTSQDTAGFKTHIEQNRITGDLKTRDYVLSKTWNISNSSYGNDLHVSFKNTTSQPMKVQLRVLAGSGIVAENAIDTQYIEANWISPEKIVHKKNPGVGKTKIAEEPFYAASMKSRHFSSAVKSESEMQYYPAVQGISKKDFVAYLATPEFTLKPGQTWEEHFLVYIGPNRVDELEPFGLGNIVNFGKLDPICKLLVGGMQLIYNIVHNYGVAIILLTMVINILLMPLTKTSFMSMRRMQLVQPEMQKLREKYKKDASKLNQEMMALYKKHKVNPMGGCFPMILQMPVFISLYVALSKSVELLGSKFLWVKNLAAPDMVHLPFTLPVLGDSIHILPLVMVLAMVFQQRTSMASMSNADPNMARQQKIMLIFMPIFFGFIFYPMPSGLVIYWLTNTVVMTTYQRFLKKQTIAPIPRPAR